MVIYSWHDTVETPSHFSSDSKQRLTGVWSSASEAATELNHSVVHRLESCCNPIMERKQGDSTDSVQYLPTLQSNPISPKLEIKRSRCRPEPTLQLPGIKILRKNSISDSIITNSNSSSSVAWDTSDSESESILPFTDVNSTDNKSPTLSSISSITRIQCTPHPPASPRSSKTRGHETGQHTFQKHRIFKRSQHFELTLQNIEEVIDQETTTNSSSFSSLKYSKQSSSVAGRPTIKSKRSEVISRRSYSTPVDYNELKQKIEDSKLVNMGVMSPEFTRNLLAKKEEEESERKLRERCVSWLQSLSNS